MNTFHLRSYGRTELALEYNPHLSPGAAWRKMAAWLARVPGLMERLATYGDIRSRTFTPSQVRLIVEALGEP